MKTATRRTTLSRILPCLLPALLACVSGVAESADLTEMSLESLLNVTLTGASRYEQKLGEAPSFACIVTAEDIRRYGYRSLAELLRSHPGIFTTYDRNYTYLGIRGFQPPGDYNTRILLLVDGHRVNDGIYDQAVIGDEFPVDVDLIERVEIVRGPSSSLYGSNAFFGVINVVTKRGGQIGGGEVSADAGSRRTYTGRVTLGRHFAGGAEILFSGTASDAHGQRSLYFPEYDDPSTHNGRARDDDGEKFQNLFAKVSWGDFTLEGVYGNRKKQLPTGAYGTEFDNGGTNTIDRHTFLDLRYEKELPTGVNLLARAYYDDYDYRGDYLFAADVPGGPDVVNKDSANSDSWGVEVTAVATGLKHHRLTAGAEFRDDFRQDQQTFDVGDPPSLDSRQSSRTWAMFLQDEFRIHPKLILSAGVRYDHYSDFGGTTNPRVGLIWMPLDRTSAKLLYGRAFRAPNSYEKYYGDQETAKPNPELEPETMHTYEFVLEQVLEGFGGTWKATAAAFHYRIDDLITQEVDPADGLTYFANNESIEANGVELELSGRLSGGVEGRASFSWQRAEFRDGGGTPANAPKHLAKLNLSLPLLTDRLFFSPEAQYLGSRKTFPGKTQESVGGYVVANATLVAARLPWGMELSASVYNLFDKRFSDPVGGDFLQDSIPQDGRSYRLKATCRF